MILSKKPTQRPIQPKGFTLVEATTAILMSLAIAGIGLSLINQQIFFQAALSRQKFIAEDGPVACNLMSRIFNKADRFLVYGSAEDARAGNNPVLAGGSAVILSFRNPNNTFSFVMIAEEVDDEVTNLNYYHRDGNSWASEPSWTVVKGIESAEFNVVNGVFRANVSGPNGGEIILSGTSQL